MATRADVDRVLHGLIQRLDEAQPSAKASLPSDRTIVCLVPDLDLRYRGRYRGGRIGTFRRVKDSEPGDITIEVSSDDLVALAEGRLSLPTALLTRRLSVDASARDLLLLRQLL